MMTIVTYKSKSSPLNSFYFTCGRCTANVPVFGTIIEIRNSKRDILSFYLVVLQMLLLLLVVVVGGGGVVVVVVVVVVCVWVCARACTRVTFL